MLKVPASNMQVYLRDASAQTIVRAATIESISLPHPVTVH